MSCSESLRTVSWRLNSATALNPSQPAARIVDANDGYDHAPRDDASRASGQFSSDSRHDARYTLDGLPVLRSETIPAMYEDFLGDDLVARMNELIAVVNKENPAVSQYLMAMDNSLRTLGVEDDHLLAVRINVLLFYELLRRESQAYKLDDLLR